MNNKFKTVGLNNGHTWDEINGGYNDSKKDLYTDALGLPKDADKETIRNTYQEARTNAEEEWRKMYASSLGLPEDADWSMIQEAEMNQENNKTL